MGTKERRERRRSEIRQEILDAARDLFVREGYTHVSLRKIAEKVEYSPGTIYLYFKDKADILACLCEETFAKLTARLQDIHEDTGPPMDALRRGLRLYIEFGLQHPQHYLVTFVLSPASLQEEGLDGRMMMAGLKCFSNLQRVVERCTEANLLRMADSAEASQSLWAGVHGLTSLLITKEKFPFVERTRLIDSHVQTLIEGIRRHPG